MQFSIAEGMVIINPTDVTSNKRYFPRISPDKILSNFPRAFEHIFKVKVLARTTYLSK